MSSLKYPRSRLGASRAWDFDADAWGQASLSFAG